MDTTMSEEQLAEVSAQEPVQTAAPELDTTKPEDSQATKTFTQEELDAAIGKRLAREQRKWEREYAARMAEAQKAAPKDVPSVDQFESVDQYAEALAMRKAEELITQREMQRQQRALMDAYHDKEEDARSRYDDFEQVAYNPSLPITNVMAETIQASDAGPDVAYYLGSNPKEAQRISQLPPYLQAKEIGKIEAKLSSNPPVKKVTNAPAPISPVTPKGGVSSGYDTTDPRSCKTMSTSEWIEAERQRQIKKLQQQRY